MIVWLWLGCAAQQSKTTVQDTAAPPPETDTVQLDSAERDSGESLPPIDTGPQDTASADTGSDSEAPLSPCGQIILLEAFGAANRLWRYDIESGDNAPVLTPACSGMTALSANGKGEIFGLNHSEQNLYEIDPATGSCQETALPTHPDYPDLQFRGLAFVGSDSSEKLYLSAIESPNARQALLFDSEAQGLKFIAALAGLTEEKAFVDLAGTNTGRLFGLHPSNGGSIIKEWAPDTGVLLSNMPTLTPEPTGWSFVWHEDLFTLFISTQGAHSYVYRFDPNSGALTARPDLPFRVVGAALSSCAPDESGS